jgi:hypothetical protein
MPRVVESCARAGGAEAGIPASATAKAVASATARAAGAAARVLIGVPSSIMPSFVGKLA